MVYHFLMNVSVIWESWSKSGQLRRSGKGRRTRLVLGQWESVFIGVENNPKHAHCELVF
jgi:hypothetical protein